MTTSSVIGGVPVHVEPCRTLPLVSIVIGFAIGSASDPRDREGAFEIALETLDCGAGDLDGHEIARRLDLLGGSLSLDVSRSFATIEAQVLRRNLGPFVDLLETMLARPTFEEREVERVKREAVAELVEERDDDHALVERAFGRTFFAGHPYAARKSPTTVAAMTVDEIRAIHRDRISRASLVLGFAGDIDDAEALALAARLASALPERGACRILPEPSPRPGRHLVFVDKPERTQTQMLVGLPGTSPRDDDHFALLVASMAMGGPVSSRLTREVRKKRGFSYGAMGRLGVDCIRQDFAMGTFPSNENSARCLALEIELLEAFVRDGITKRELGFARRFLVGSAAFDGDTAEKRMARSVQAALVGLPASYWAGYRERIATVTLDAANAAIAARFCAENLTIAVVGSFAEVGARLQASVPRMSSSIVVPYDAAN